MLSLLRHRLGPAPDILFVAGSQVDLQWVLPAYERAVACGLHCAFAGPGLVVPAAAHYVDITVHLLRFVSARVMVTSTSGLTPARMPRSCARRVAIPHSLVSLHMVYPAGTFDGYTDIFCCGEHHVAEIEALNQRDGVAGRRPVLIGYGKLERLAATRPAGPQARDGPSHVLIGPSWGPGNILETMGEALLTRLIQGGHRVTLRPHPSFFIYGDDTIQRIVNCFRDEPGFVIENSIEESRALWSADLMIADYSGFAMEFAFVRERPVLYINVPTKVLNPGWADLGQMPVEVMIRNRIGVVVEPAVEQVLEGLALLGGNLNGWADRIRQERARYWVNFGNFGQASANELSAMLEEFRQ